MADDYKTVEATLRTEDFGSAGSRRLLKTGRIPAVVYGKGEVKHISIDAKAFGFTLRVVGKGMALKIKLGKKSINCVLQALQEDLASGTVKHVDFKEV